jgi:H+/Cl- antiporter ClcA
MDWRSLAQWTGLAVMVLAALLSNIAVQKMAQVVNSKRSSPGKVKWEFKGDRANREVIRRYRESNPSGPLFRNFLAACGLFVVGVAIMFLKNLP